jgi:hypothetical protein
LFVYSCDEKAFFENGPWRMSDNFYAALVTPVVHYTMGGLEVNGAAQVIGSSGAPISGLWCAGECAGGVHGVNRLGGSSLLDCVVFGRVAGRNASKYVLQNLLSGKTAAGAGAGEALSFTVTPNGDNRVSLQFSWGKGSGASQQSASSHSAASSASTAAAPAAVEAPKAAGGDRNKTFTLAEVAIHNTAADCWVVVNGVVLDVTTFLPGACLVFCFLFLLLIVSDHPGGKASIMLFAGKDASVGMDCVVCNCV